MRPRARPIKDLYFRFIQPLGLNIEPQALASLMWGLSLIELIAHKETGSTAFYRDTEAMRGLGLADLLLKLEPLMNDKDKYEKQ